MARWPAALVAVGIGVLSHAADDPYRSAREAMVEVVRQEAGFVARETRLAVPDARVLAALARVPRHEFVPKEHLARAYENRPLPIGHGQTISQPYIVAAMTDLLALRPGERALEIGTGSGYQAAILAEMGAEVYTIEIIEPLGKSARERLQRLGYGRVAARTGDGYYGWPEKAPFDAVIVTAAANHIPPPLLAQLKPGGRMVIPVGNPFGTQHLIVVKKDSAQRVTTQKVLPVRFVALTGSH
jgi:protein-L-isoaspartate(D-aspartate) O-methyltransferase